ncbi:hypothetical protein [Streptomyces sp. 3N207]|uniref:hypothetical protein n=1 Tax=Streptomyces sp. 3N207 TaxID=3457417 RepID=UPI003FD4BC7B
METHATGCRTCRVHRDTTGQPWLLNSLYSNRTVEQPRDGLPARSYGFFDDFRALQRKQDRRPVRLQKVAT